MSSVSPFEVVIGLEIHAQLATVSKLFCGDSTAFGAAPNTHVSPVTLAHPGSLPVTNKKAIEYAIRMGLACGSEIERNNYFARKNYFYPDLPKGYQISQHTTPICKGGSVTIKIAEGSRAIQLNRIHLEEDAGKSIHDLEELYTSIDLNRAGTPLIEIVTEPDLFSADEAWQYVTEVRKLVQWLDICDGNMEEGSLRCDANISLRPRGSKRLGTKVEVKNLNSIRNVKKAIEYEIERMTVILLEGGVIRQQTRSFDASTDTTFAIRDKEDANDYRYFPDPDLAPFHLSETFIASIEAGLPMLPEQLTGTFMQEYGLSEYDATQLCDQKGTADYFLAVTRHTNAYKPAANWILGPVRQYLNEQQIDWSVFPLSPARLAGLIALVESGKISFSSASARLLPAMMDNDQDASVLAGMLNLLQVNDDAEISQWVQEALARLPDKVQEYKKGKKNLLGLFVGEVKKISKGKADPRSVTRILEEQLNQS